MASSWRGKLKSFPSCTSCKAHSSPLCQRKAERHINYENSSLSRTACNQLWCWNNVFVSLITTSHLHTGPRELEQSSPGKDTQLIDRCWLWFVWLLTATTEAAAKRTKGQLTKTMIRLVTEKCQLEDLMSAAMRPFLLAVKRWAVLEAYKVAGSDQWSRQAKRNGSNARGRCRLSRHMKLPDPDRLLVVVLANAITNLRFHCIKKHCVLNNMSIDQSIFSWHFDYRNGVSSSLTSAFLFESELYERQAFNPCVAAFSALPG